jgi:hypothetical protein
MDGIYVLVALPHFFVMLLTRHVDGLDIHPMLDSLLGLRDTEYLVFLCILRTTDAILFGPNQRCITSSFKRGTSY